MIGFAGAQEEADRIIFPHVLHVEDVGVACQECHGGMATSNSLSHDLLPVMDQCLVCHDGDTAPEDCDVCHTIPDEADTYSWRPTPDLLFPHRNHLVQEVACSRCHPGISSAEALAPRIPSSMNDCMECHATPLTDAGCYTCHASLKAKLPATHGSEWAETHGLFVDVDRENDCSVCHQQSDCEACHAQAQFDKKVHPPNYEFLHAAEFLGFEKECSTCHAFPHECKLCHQSKLIMPLAHNSSDWSNIVDGGFHKEEALDQAEYCLVCHEPSSDQTCMRPGCHAH